MKVRYLTTFVFAAASWAGGCADSGSPEGSRVAIAVAPLTLPGTTGVEYALAVFNAVPSATNTFNANGTVATNLGNLVWNEPSVTSNQYGNSAGGDISYVGTCDASLGGTSDNWVALALKQIAVGTGNGSITGTGPNNTAANTSAFATGSNNILDDQITALLSNGGDGDADFENPCPFNKPCVLKAPCDENKDTEVEFNLTIMRDAEQGFFDIAVNFEDVFCSAKFDTCYNETGDQSHIELLFGDDVHDGAGRDWTGVYAMACTAGVGAGIDTEILLGDVVITCGTDTTTLPMSNLTNSAGNQIHTATLAGAARTIHYAIYHGNEQLTCDGTASCNKAYVNLAIDLENLPADCTLDLQATVQDNKKSNFTNGVLKSGLSYPFIKVEAASLNQACTWDALNDGGSVETFYGSDLVGGISANPMKHSSIKGGPLTSIGTTTSTALAVTSRDPDENANLGSNDPTITFNQQLQVNTVDSSSVKLYEQSTDPISCTINSDTTSATIVGGTGSVDVGDFVFGFGTTGVWRVLSKSGNVIQLATFDEPTTSDALGSAGQNLGLFKLVEKSATVSVGTGATGNVVTVHPTTNWIPGRAYMIWVATTLHNQQNTGLATEFATWFYAPSGL